MGGGYPVWHMRGALWCPPHWTTRGNLPNNQRGSKINLQQFVDGFRSPLPINMTLRSKTNASEWRRQSTLHSFWNNVFAYVDNGNTPAKMCRKLTKETNSIPERKCLSLLCIVAIRCPILPTPTQIGKHTQGFYMFPSTFNYTALVWLPFPNMYIMCMSKLSECFINMYV